jgi:hypothetical protein
MFVKKNSLLADFTVQYPNCAVWGETRGDCGQPIFAYFIFIIFHILCSYIFVNLLTVVSVILVDRTEILIMH